MACAYWRTDHTVGSLLQEREVGWEFLQLVKLLLFVAGETQLKNDNDTLQSLSKHVGFKASLASDFPPGEIRQVDTTDAMGRVNITLVSNVLSSANGPLPEPFFTWVKESSGRGDHAMADFLDIFNNRLAALRYLVSRGTRPNLVDTSVQHSEIGDLLQALSGVFFNREVQKSDFQLSGLLANKRMSYPVVKQLLQFEMGITLSEMRSYQGGWLHVDREDHSHLGQGSSILGVSATLGTKVWDQQKAIEWLIAVLPWNKIQALIPGGQHYNRFASLLSRISDGRSDSHIILQVNTGDIPKIKIETNTNVHLSQDTSPLALGLTTVLSTAKQQKDTSSITQITFTIETSNPNFATSLNKPS